jgi:hypothetical protein
MSDAMDCVLPRLHAILGVPAAVYEVPEPLPRVSGMS